jgi:hypothetical protein
MADFYYRIGIAGRANNCKWCNGKIEKGENVIVLSVWAGNKGGSERYCMNCGPKIMDEKIKKFQDFKIQLKKATKVYYITYPSINTF